MANDEKAGNAEQSRNLPKFNKIDIESKWPITFSVGVVTYIETKENIDDVIGLADRIMYKVKNAGKNSMSHEVVGSPGSAFGSYFENTLN